MKRLLFSTITAVFLLSVCLSCFDSEDTKISVTDSDDTYEFYAKFDKSKMGEIQNFINRKIAPSSIVTDKNMDITTTLNDNTQFQLKESPGKIRIILDKEDNSVASYIRIKKMCEGIKGIISEKKN
ncbi:hypothetical protein [Dyadobacter sp. NIV53]|uniref:hypothetical protein n=1 Tax=Dyadobacter sp. NIV53 TaxID=2861765 RepID=UPI001C87C57E|nr:hypothetical protein [Dyadobacter sp. NIV53]